MQEGWAESSGSETRRANLRAFSTASLDDVSTSHSGSDTRNATASSGSYTCYNGTDIPADVRRTYGREAYACRAPIPAPELAPYANLVRALARTRADTTD